MPNLSTIEHFEVGDLVTFNFPFSDGGSKTRICAIVARDPDLNEVVVAYGTSNLRVKNNPHHALALITPADWKSAGLHEATRFQVDRRIRVKLGDSRFKQNKSLGTAKVGQIPLSLTRRLCEIYNQLPVATLNKEMQGIHPKPTKGPRRPTFLGRRRGGQGAKIAA